MSRWLRSLYIVWAIVPAAGCVSFGDLAGSLSDAILNQRDAHTVEDGTPAYLILIDALIAGEPDDAELLLAGSRLYGAYGSAFVADSERATLMAGKAWDYARRAVCEELEALCPAVQQSADDYAQALAQIEDADDVSYLFGLGAAWAGWIQANAGDWRAIADLPKVQSTIERVLALDETYEGGSAHIYMGVLLTLRPASLGGHPEQGRRHFEQAIALSEERNLMAKVLFARHYARLVFDRELHNSLLREVLAAEVDAPGLTLINTLAQKQAQQLLDSADEYF